MELKSKIIEVFKGGGLYSIASLIQNMIYFFLIPVYTTYLSTADYGVIGLMTITAGIILNITKIPTATAFVRFYYSPEYESKRKPLLFNSIVFALFQSGAYCSFVFLFSNSFAEMILDSSKYNIIIQIYSVIIFLQPLENIVQDLLKIKKKVKLFVTMLLTNVFITTILILVLLIYFDKGIMALVFGTLFTTIYTIVFLSKELKNSMEFKFDWQLLKSLLKYGYPLVISALSFFLLRSVDQYLIKYYFDISQVGIYSFGYSFGWLIAVFFALPLSSIIEPIIFEMEKNKEELIAFIKKSSKYIFFAGTLIWLGLSLFSKEVIELMAQKQEFWEAIPLIPIIGFAYLFYGLIFILNKGIELAKKTYIISFINILGLLLNIILNIIFLPKYGLYSAAINLVLALIFILLTTSFYSKKHYGISVDFASIFKISIIGIIFYLISLLFIKFNLVIFIFIKIVLLVLFLLLVFVSLFSLEEKKAVIYFLKKVKKK